MTGPGHKLDGGRGSHNAPRVRHKRHEPWAADLPRVIPETRRGAGLTACC